MTILFDATRPVKAHNRVFGLGLATPVTRKGRPEAPSEADSQWWARECAEAVEREHESALAWEEMNDRMTAALRDEYYDRMSQEALERELIEAGW